jgi:hypothetical protein
LQKAITENGCQKVITFLKGLFDSIKAAIETAVKFLKMLACYAIPMALSLIGAAADKFLQATFPVLATLAVQPWCLAEKINQKKLVRQGGSRNLLAKTKASTTAAVSNSRGSVELIWETFKYFANKSGNKDLKAFAESDDANLVMWIVFRVWDAVCGAIGTAVAALVTELILCNVCSLGCGCTVKQLNMNGGCAHWDTPNDPAGKAELDLFVTAAGGLVQTGQRTYNFERARQFNVAIEENIRGSRALRASSSLDSGEPSAEDIPVKNYVVEGADGSVKCDQFCKTKGYLGVWGPPNTILSDKKKDGCCAAGNKWGKPVTCKYCECKGNAGMPTTPPTPVPATPVPAPTLISTTQLCANNNIILGDRWIGMGRWRFGELADGRFTFSYDNNAAIFFNTDGTRSGGATVPGLWNGRGASRSQITFQHNSIKIGNWVIGQYHGLHLSLGHSSGTTTMIWVADGTQHPGPRPIHGSIQQGNMWNTPAGTPNIKISSWTVQIGDFRIGNADSAHFSISSNTGYGGLGIRTEVIYRYDSTVHPGPRTCCGLGQLNTFGRNIAATITYN